MIRINRRKLMIGGGLGALMAIPACMFLSSEEEIHEMDIKFTMLQSFRDFFLENNIDPEFFLSDDGEDELDIRSSFGLGRRNRQGEKMAYNLEIMGKHSVKLPQGRYVSFDVESGHMYGFMIYLPVENLDLAKALFVANQCASRFSLAGYEQTFANPRKITEELIAETTVYIATHSRWRCPLQGIREVGHAEYSVIITSSRGSYGSTLPPVAALLTGRRLDEPAVYMLRIEAKASGEIFDELRKLSRARRGGVPNSYIPLRDWYDDPNWRPDGWDGKYICIIPLFRGIFVTLLSLCKNPALDIGGQRGAKPLLMVPLVFAGHLPTLQNAAPANPKIIIADLIFEQTQTKETTTMVVPHDNALAACNPCL